MKEYQKPMLNSVNVNIDDILSVSMDDGMFNMGITDESGLGVGGFDEIW